MASKDKSGQSYGKGRTRNFATVFYPESAPENFRELISELHVPCFLSPLHDRDKTAAGEEKKPHYHLLLVFDSVKTFEQVTNFLSDKLPFSVGCEVIASLRSYARYLCHLDDPDKAQYSPDNVVSFGGLDYRDVIASASDRYLALSEMMDFCDKYDVTAFHLLVKYARQNRPDWFRILCDSGTVVMREYLKSRDWSKGKCIHHILDQESGEVII